MSVHTERAAYMYTASAVNGSCSQQLYTQQWHLPEACSAAVRAPSAQQWLTPVRRALVTEEGEAHHREDEHADDEKGHNVGHVCGGARGRGQSTVGKGALTRIEDHMYICMPACKSACIRACVIVCACIGALV